MPQINEIPTATPNPSDLVPAQPAAGATRAVTVGSLPSGFNDGSLTIAKTSGLQTALNGKQRVRHADIRDHGAVCDGVTDDSAAIQAAIDSLDATYGGDVVLPPGRILCLSTITITDVSGYGGRGTRLIGTGGMRFRDGQNGTERPGGTTLVAGTPSMTLLKCNAGAGSYAGTCIEGVHFEEKDSAHTAILVNFNVMNFWTMRDCVVVGGLRGILVDAQTGDASWGMIDNCHIKDCTSGIRITGDVGGGTQGTPGIRVFGGSFAVNTGQVGYEITSNCHHNQIIGTKFDVNGTGNGINIDGAANFTEIVGVNMEGPTTGSFIDIGMGTGRAMGTQVVATSISGTKSPVGGTGIRLHGSAGSPATQVKISAYLTSLINGMWATDTTKCTLDVSTQNNTVGVLLDSSVTANRLSHQSYVDATPITDNGTANTQVTTYQGQVKAMSSATNVTPSRTIGFAGQTANLATWETAAGALQASVSADGNTMGVNGGAGSPRSYVKAEASGGSVGMTKLSAQGSSPGAGQGKIYFRDGTNAGTLKLVVLAGASGAETTILDNIPQT